MLAGKLCALVYSILGTFFNLFLLLTRINTTIIQNNEFKIINTPDYTCN